MFTLIDCVGSMYVADEWRGVGGQSVCSRLTVVVLLTTHTHTYTRTHTHTERGDSEDCEPGGHAEQPDGVDEGEPGEVGGFKRGAGSAEGASGGGTAGGEEG